MTAEQTRRAFEAALAEDPDDLAGHMAYADWLQEQGDPRGEFIRVQLALEDPSRSSPERKELRQREQELLSRHGVEWLGPLGGFCSLEEPQDWDQSFARFARGWVDELILREVDDQAALEALAQAPQVRLLRALSIPYLMAGEPVDRDRGEILAGSPYLGNLRAVKLGTEGSFSLTESLDVAIYNSRWELYPTSRGMWDFLSRLPRLKDLYLHCMTPGIEALFASPDASGLDLLEIYFSNHYPVEALASGPASRSLRCLSLHPAACDEGEREQPFLQLPQLEAIARPGVLPGLTHLRFRKSPVGDAGCEVIVRSGLLGRLKYLDLSLGTITDAGADVLARCPDLEHLEHLRLESNALTPAGIRRLTGVLGARLLGAAEYQHDEGDDSFLYEGYME